MRPMSRSDVTAEPVWVDQRGAVTLVTLANPSTRNALSRPLLTALRTVAEAIADDPHVRAVVITGEGRAFAAGADLREIERASPDENLAYNRLILEAFGAVARLPVPTIAAVNGHALGGGLELALACTLRVAALEARLGLPEVRLGLLPGAGGTQRLPRLVGAGVAWRMLLTGEPLDAERALAAGLVDELAPAEEVLERALDLAACIAQAAPLSVRAVLRTVREGADRPLDEGIEVAHEALAPLLASADLGEGIAAFRDRRDPEFTGA